MVDGRFVVHEHQGRRHHYDFRLEINGVLKSWALPGGPSMNPSERRVAIMVADHPLEYIDFEGVIPAGRYGTGPVVIWDGGIFSTTGDKSAVAELRRGELLFVLYGSKLRGGFALMRLAGGDASDWLLVKRKDSSADDGWRLQSALTPQRRRTLVERPPPCGGG